MNQIELAKKEAKKIIKKQIKGYEHFPKYAEDIIATKILIKQSENKEQIRTITNKIKQMKDMLGPTYPINYNSLLFEIDNMNIYTKEEIEKYEKIKWEIGEELQKIQFEDKEIQEYINNAGGEICHSLTSEFITGITLLKDIKE